MAKKCRRHGRERCTYSFCKDEEGRSTDSSSSYDPTFDIINTTNVINAASYDSTYGYDAGSSSCDSGSYS